VLFFCLIFLKFTEIHAFSTCDQHKRVATLSSHAAWTQHSLQMQIVFEKTKKGKKLLFEKLQFFALPRKPTRCLSLCEKKKKKKKKKKKRVLPFANRNAFVREMPIEKQR
jgi:hypothetical protein